MPTRTYPDQIQIISAPSILGLRPTGVENLAGALLNAGLAEEFDSKLSVIQMSPPNNLYSAERDIETNCLNSNALKSFSEELMPVISASIGKQHFPLVLGGDCSILLGIMPALKQTGAYGLIFADAHADFYSPEKSISGEVADMDLAIVTGHGPELLTNIKELKPYVIEENVIHIGQRDYEETKQYESPDIRQTRITCFDLKEIRSEGIIAIAENILSKTKALQTQGFWLHFDTDVLVDNINPAVDYRLSDGLQFQELHEILSPAIANGLIIGMSVTIYNPTLDADGHIARALVSFLRKLLRR